MKKALTVSLGVWLVAFSFIVFDSSPAKAAPAGFSNQLLTASLNQPTDIAFVPDGRILIAQKGGQVMIFQNNQLTQALAMSTSSISTGGDRGLLSLTLDPAFSSNHFIYLFYTSGTNHQRISRFTMSGNTINAASETVLLENPEIWSGFLNAGAVRFGPDGKLYGSFGSNGEGAIAQDLSSLDGKFVRINADGTIPGDNPFVSLPGAQPSIYSTGFRNPWRFNFGADGKAIIGDVGEDTAEKIVRAQSGANYGWPNFEGDCRPNCNGITPPLYVYLHNGAGAAVVGGDVNRGTNFPAAYANHYFFGDYVNGYIKDMTLDAGGNVASVQDFFTGVGVLSAINMGPEGCMYYLTIFPGEFHKICFNAPTSVTANATVDKTSGNLPLTVNFSSTGSADSSGAALNYSWNFGDGGTSTAVNPAHTYTVKGVYKVTLTVSNANGSASANLSIWAGYLPPSPRITAPLSTQKWNAGDTINFSATATDPQDGNLPASAYFWKIIFHHNTHIHPPTEVVGQTGGTFTIPTELHTQTVDLSYEFQLTVTDSVGLASTTSVFINPNVVTLNVATNPSGLSVLLDSQPITTPYTSPAIPGYIRSLGATSPQVLGGTNYNFASWSSGGAQTQTFAMPTTSQTYTATYTTGGTAPLTFNLGASVGAATYKSGDSATITTTASANQNISNLLVDTELWSGGKILQNVVSPVNFAVNTTQNFNWNFAAPTTQGNYTVKTGIFASDWSKLYMWNDNAATLTVGTSTTATSTGPLTFTDSAKTDTATYNGGAPVALTSNIMATQNVPNVVLDSEIYNASNVKVGQNVVTTNLVANQNFASVFNTTAPTTAGTYTIKLGVFQNDWSKLYFWDNGATTFTVGSATPPPPPPPLAFAVSASMPATTFSAGATTQVTTKVAATQNVPGVAISTEIYDANNVKVGQNVANTDLVANQQYTTTWNAKLPTTNGTYTVKVGVFSADYSKLYFWANRAFQFTIGNPPPPPQPGQTYPVTVIVPTNGSTVSGVTEIKAVINGLDINTYNIGWRTGGGAFFTLDTEPVNQSYKHAWIDFGTWTWSPNSIYPIEFRATDLNNNIIGSMTISVFVQH